MKRIFLIAMLLGGCSTVKNPVWPEVDNRPMVETNGRPIEPVRGVSVDTSPERPKGKIEVTQKGEAARNRSPLSLNSIHIVDIWDTELSAANLAAIITDEYLGIEITLVNPEQAPSVSTYLRGTYEANDLLRYLVDMLQASGASVDVSEKGIIATWSDERESGSTVISVDVTGNASEIAQSVGALFEDGLTVTAVGRTVFAKGDLQQASSAYSILTQIARSGRTFSVETYSDKTGQLREICDTASQNLNDLRCFSRGRSLVVMSTDKSSLQVIEQLANLSANEKPALYQIDDVKMSGDLFTASVVMLGIEPETVVYDLEHNRVKAFVSPREQILLRSALTGRPDNQYTLETFFYVVELGQDRAREFSADLSGDLIGTLGTVDFSSFVGIDYRGVTVRFTDNETKASNQSRERHTLPLTLGEEVTLSRVTEIPIVVSSSLNTDTNRIDQEVEYRDVGLTITGTLLSASDRLSVSVGVEQSSIAATTISGNPAINLTRFNATHSTTVHKPFLIGHTVGEIETASKKKIFGIETGRTVGNSQVLVVVVGRLTNSEVSPSSRIFEIIETVLPKS